MEQGYCLFGVGFLHRGSPGLARRLPRLLSASFVDLVHALSTDSPDLSADELRLATGPIWAALNVDYPHHSFEGIGLFFGLSVI